MTPSRAGRSRIGILGGGRLGKAIALRCQAIENCKVEAWSRRFDAVDQTQCTSADDMPFMVVPIASVMSAPVVFAAIPSRGLAQLAELHRSIGEFSGALLVTGIDLSLDAMQRLIPAALVVRVVPSLLSACHSIPCLVLDRGCAGTRWERAAAVLNMLGPVLRVDDEQAFESIMYLTSPFPVVLRNALADAVASTLTRRGIDRQWQTLAERVLWESLASSARMQTASIEGEIATPGGVTATGLREVPLISRALQDALQVMMRHGELLRDRWGSTTCGP